MNVRALEFCSRSAPMDIILPNLPPISLLWRLRSDTYDPGVTSSSHCSQRCPIRNFHCSCSYLAWVRSAELLTIFDRLWPLWSNGAKVSEQKLKGWTERQAKTPWKWINIFIFLTGKWHIMFILCIQQRIIICIIYNYINA